jgi:hypothetical protein
MHGDGKYSTALIARPAPALKLLKTILAETAFPDKYRIRKGSRQRAAMDEQRAGAAEHTASIRSR